MISTTTCKQLNLKINEKNKNKIDQVKDAFSTEGTTTFPLTINGITKLVTANVINFRHDLLLGMPISDLFFLIITMTTSKVTLSHTKTLQLESCYHVETNSTMNHTSDMRKEITESQQQQREQQQLNELLHKYHHVFAKDDADIGSITTAEHQLYLTSDKPIYKQQYRQSQSD